MSPVRVLVVEDDPASLALAQTLLESDGYVVLAATDAAEAIEIVTNHTIDVALIDLVLPDRSGTDLAHALRGIPHGSDLPLVAMSAHFSPLDDARISPHGFSDYLAKPLDAAALLGVLRELAPARSDNHPPSGAGRSVLVVDDEPVLLRLLRHRFERMGFRVETASTGPDALEACRAHPPDAVVADALMPDMDGFDLCAAMRREPALAAIPFLLISSHYVEPEDAALARAAGATRFVARGPSLDRVADALVQVLDPNVPPGDPVDGPAYATRHARRVRRQLDRQIGLNQALRERSAFQQTLLSVAATIAEVPSHALGPSELLARCLPSILSAGTFTGAAAYLLDRSGQLTLGARVGALPPTGVDSAWGWMDQARAATTSGETLVLEPARTDDGAALQASQGILVPLGDPTLPLGVLVLTSARSRPDAEVFAFLRTLRQVLGRAIHAAREEARFLHAQRMDALGRLAGGIAHDFNNVLSAIGGFAFLASEALDDAHPARGDLTEITGAVERGAALTARLLAFSRREVGETERVEPDRLIAQLTPMLRRVLGERIAVETRFGCANGWIWGNRDGFDQSLLNLAINARDAMPNGGTLTIATSREMLAHHSPLLRPNQPGGAYVIIRVSDSGDGMDAETLARAFEPFFTTKPAGLGTGLGLSTVHSLVHQADGNVVAESTPGRGTTIHLVFPLAEPPPRQEAAAAPMDATGAEGVLLVEDEDAVRRALARVLRQAGYGVLEASNAAEAEPLARTAAVQVLVTDVVMPGKTGPELAVRVWQERPTLPVVFMSGYPGDHLAHLPETGRGPYAFVQKPFTTSDVARTIRELLARRP